LSSADQIRAACVCSKRCKLISWFFRCQ
jgi:hypothetical protein